MIPPLFNPSNDMALAANLPQYVPPQRIQQMECDLASLSRFWDQGPWGWSLATRQRYRQMGVSDALLPSDQWLAHLRQISSRATAADYLAHLLSPSWCGRLVGRQMRFLTRFPDTHEQQLVFKSPWSSSGRGIVFAPQGLTPDVQRRVRDMLRTQGGCLQDHLYLSKTLDFAMEFWVHSPTDVRFLGYSVFRTSSQGDYGGNLVASQQHLLELIDVDPSLLQRLVRYHCLHLGLLGYTGPVGIDMMRLIDSRLHPVVEMNFRMNMGILAILLHDQGFTADQPLTPAVSHGFQAVIRDGMLQILYHP